MIDEQYLKPDWDGGNRCYNWRRYISDEVADMWDTFTSEQKSALGRQAQEAADREEWE